MNQAPYSLRTHNPDVLSCIANLSNDEVFTPPDFANQMLDTLTKEWGKTYSKNLWEDKNIKFLDPGTKSGVYLREIVKRLNTGLARSIPDLTERVDHILTKQVYGIGITEMTSLLARRSIYCSKDARGIHSVARSFQSRTGNIWFERIEHDWQGARCGYCGASKSEYERSLDLETHAYAFIHSNNIKADVTQMYGEDMKFDVIIGNPPYQLSDGGAGTSAQPIYHHFVRQAKTLEPRFISMVIPARWYSGGKGLDEFRNEMLNDKRLRCIEDFPDSSDVFPGVQIKGGICYFLWIKDSQGDATITTHDKGKVLSRTERPLLEKGADVFIRYNEAIPILKKIMQRELGIKYSSLILPAEKRFAEVVSVRRPFNLDGTYRGRTKHQASDIQIYRAGGIDYAKSTEIDDPYNLINKWKIFMPYLASGSDSFPHPILGAPLIGGPGSASTETYLAIGPFKSKSECQNVISYISTRLFRFIVLQKKPSQHATRKVYEFIPMQDFSEEWNDEKLYKKYGITTEEIAFIESLVRPMELSGE